MHVESPGEHIKFSLSQQLKFVAPDEQLPCKGMQSTHVEVPESFVKHSNL